MKSIAIFNNKGGVGKTTLAYHLAYALAEMGHRTLLLDLDPQSNLTLFGATVESLHDIWEREDPFIDDLDRARSAESARDLAALISGHRSVHFLLKPTEEGTSEHEDLSVPLP